MIQRNNCIRCSIKNEIIHTEKEVPISFTTTKNKTNYKYSKLIYGYCDKCNIIQLNELIDLDILYENGHNYQVVGDTWKQYFSQFVDILTPYIKNKNVLEIGCPSGKIANNCNDYNLWNIIDPNVKIFDNKKIIKLYRPKIGDECVKKILDPVSTREIKFVPSCNSLGDFGDMYFGTD